VREPRLTTVMGVARAVIATVGPRDAARVLIDEFGWDVTFQALALLRGDEAAATFGATWSALVLDDAATEVDDAVAVDDALTPDDAAVVDDAAPDVGEHTRPDRWHPSLGPGQRES
jgi:hypothetical protein